jgi:hypothetical protein
LSAGEYTGARVFAGSTFLSIRSNKVVKRAKAFEEPIFC